jgi:hypothetical protein
MRNRLPLPGTCERGVASCYCSHRSLHFIPKLDNSVPDVPSASTWISCATECRDASTQPTWSTFELLRFRPHACFALAPTSEMSAHLGKVTALASLTCFQPRAAPIVANLNAATSFFRLFQLTHSLLTPLISQLRSRTVRRLGESKDAP